MKKKVISDIRLFKSWVLSESGTDITTSFGDKNLNAITRRIAMKLRESEFSLGDFDHLYINFTTYDLDKEMNLSTKVDRYHPWYRYCNIPVEKDFHNILGSPQSYEGIVHWIATALITYFSTEDFDQSRILAGVQQAVEQGEQMLMKFKEKSSAKRKAVVFLRYLDTCRYCPLLRVYDTEDNLLFEKDLPETVMLDYLGEIQVSAKKVTIKPRKNAFTSEYLPMVFEY